MHLDIKKMKKLSTKALNDGLNFFIDQVSGEENLIHFCFLFLLFTFHFPGNGAENVVIYFFFIFAQTK